MGAVAVMDVAGTMKDIEKLPGLRHSTVQVVVAARPLLPRVVADRGAFGVSAGGGHGTIEVQRQTSETLPPQGVEHHSRAQLSHLVDAMPTHGGQRSADGGDIGQAM